MRIVGCDDLYLTVGHCKGMPHTKDEGIAMTT